MKHLQQLGNILQETSCNKFPAPLPMSFDDNFECEIGLQTIHTCIFLVLRKKPRFLLALKRN